tara:strand:- start:188 stop:589 length:402 start_codon:yes stop_codon:yes gene_type:complete
MEGVGEFIAGNFMNLITPIGVLGAWFFGRKRGKADTKVVEADAKVTEGDALGGMQGGYTKFVEDMNERYDEQERKLEEQQKESSKKYEALHSDFEKFKTEIKGIISKKDEISAGRERRIKELEGQIRDLKKAS